MFGSIRLRLPRIGKWPRLLLAGTCLLLALGTALSGHKHKPAATRSVAVVVAAHDMPAGHLLHRSDLAVARWPPGLCPRRVRGDPRQLVGRRLAGPVTAREAITGSRLVSADLAAGLGPGLVAAAVVLADPRADDLVRTGDRVDILATTRPPDIADPQHTTTALISTVARSVRVLAVLPAGETTDAELLVAVDRATAVRITRDSAGQLFTTLVDPQ